jgi:hypothetical protein
LIKELRISFDSEKVEMEIKYEVRNAELTQEMITNICNVWNLVETNIQKFSKLDALMRMNPNFKILKITHLQFQFLLLAVQEPFTISYLDSVP